MQKPLLPMNICMQRPFLPINNISTMQRNFHFSAGQSSNGMTRNNHSPPYKISAADDDEYIDIEVNSFSPQSTDFEFQMTSTCNDKELTNLFPADDLFYKGKLLPLLLPPRLQTLQTTTSATPTGDQNSINDEEDDQFIIMEFARSTPPWRNSTTGSPVEPCRLSFAFKPDIPTSLSTCINKHQERRYSWFSKLRLIMKCLIGDRRKASRACLMSFFRKSACIDISSAMAAPDYNPAWTDKQVSNGFQLKAEQRKSVFGHLGMWRNPIKARVIDKIREGIEDKVKSNHRRPLSFSSTQFKRRSSSSSSPSFSSSSSFSSISFSSSDSYELKRSCSFTSDIDGPIDAAIAHCKKSQEPSISRKTSGHFALSSTPKLATKFKSECNSIELNLLQTNPN